MQALVGDPDSDTVKALREALRHMYYYDGPQKNITRWDYWERWCKAAGYDPSKDDELARKTP